jgi:hypothetical protein
VPFAGDARPLAVVNAGCCPDLGAARGFVHEHGQVLGSRWIETAPVARRVSRLVAA